MTGYARKFKENTTMSLRVNNKNFLKNLGKIWEVNVNRFWEQTCLW